MMNALRLNQGVAAQLYQQRTGLPLNTLQPVLDSLRERQLMVDDLNVLSCTEKVYLFKFGIRRVSLRCRFYLKAQQNDLTPKCWAF